MERKLRRDRKETAAHSSQPSQNEENSRSCSPPPLSEELITLVNETVLYVLTQDQNKLPIKRTDIVKNVLNGNGKSFNTIIQEVRRLLPEIFGMKLTDLDHSNKQYILVNLKKNEQEETHINWTERDSSQSIVLMVVLSLIFMRGNVVKEEEVWSVLEPLQLLSEEAEKQCSGSVKNFIKQECVRQLYLEYNHIPNTDPPKYEFRFGKRAKKEISRQEILNFVCKMYMVSNPEQWATQHQEALKEEGMKKK